MPKPIVKQAVVIGAGMGGLASAKAVAPHVEKVVVFEREPLPDAPAPRSATLQPRHTLGLLAGGHRALECLFPGFGVDFADAFFTEIQRHIKAPWAVAITYLIYPQTRGERPPNFEEQLQKTHTLMRLAAEDYETDEIVFEVRALLKPQSALRECRLAARVMAMMADQRARPSFRRREPPGPAFDFDQTRHELTPAE